MTGRRAGVRALLLAGALTLTASGPAAIRKTGFSYLGETGADGFYVIVARLGDESDFTGRRPVESLTLFPGTLKRFLTQ